MKKRVILIVLDSVGIGELPDAADFGDVGSNTLKSCFDSGKLDVANLSRLGLFNIDGLSYADTVSNPIGSFARMVEKSNGKDTTIGHWEISGIHSMNPLPTYPKGFPEEIIEQFVKETGREVLCNLPYSGTDVIKEFGEEHMKTGALIVYTSGDSVFQIAANEQIIPVDELYKYCKIARKILTGKHAVGRVIARPFIGDDANSFTRTSKRHDYSLLPPKKTVCNYISEAGYLTYGIGKINDIFVGSGIDKSVSIKDNNDGMIKTINAVKDNENAFIFTNLVDFDMKYGHRNNVLGYTNALNEFDVQLAELLDTLQDNDILMLTADHGCDPGTSSTDHSREYTPLIAYGKNVKKSINMHSRSSFSDIAATIMDIYNLKGSLDGESFWDIIKIV